MKIDIPLIMLGLSFGVIISSLAKQIGWFWAIVWYIITAILIFWNMWGEYKDGLKRRKNK